MPPSGRRAPTGGVLRSRLVAQPQPPQVCVRCDTAAPAETGAWATRPPVVRGVEACSAPSGPAVDAVPGHAESASQVGGLLAHAGVPELAVLWVAWPVDGPQHRNAAEESLDAAPRPHAAGTPWLVDAPGNAPCYLDRDAAAARPLVPGAGRAHPCPAPSLGVVAFSEGGPTRHRSQGLAETTATGDATGTRTVAVPVRAGLRSSTRSRTVGRNAPAGVRGWNGATGAHTNAQTSHKLGRKNNPWVHIQKTRKPRPRPVSRLVVLHRCPPAAGLVVVVVARSPRPPSSSPEP